MGIVHERNDLVEEIRLPAGGSFVITDEIGTELFRVTADGDQVKVNKIAFDPATLDELATLGGLTASVDELNLLDGVTATTAELNAVDVSAMPVARTATSDGLTTGIIAAAGLIQFVTVTSANANNIIVLPAPAPGTIVILTNGATGYELRSSAPATISINGGAEAAAESAIAADSTVIAICISATAWKAIFLDADADVAKIEVAAA